MEEKPFWITMLCTLLGLTTAAIMGWDIAVLCLALILWVCVGWQHSAAQQEWKTRSRLQLECQHWQERLSAYQERFGRLPEDTPPSLLAK